MMMMMWMHTYTDLYIHCSTDAASGLCNLGFINFLIVKSYLKYLDKLRESVIRRGGAIVYYLNKETN